MEYEWSILQSVKIGEEFTTQSLTESMFGCKKGEQTYIQHVDEIGKVLQKLEKKGNLTKERMNTGHGYYVNKWRRIL